MPFRSFWATLYYDIYFFLYEKRKDDPGSTVTKGTNLLRVNALCRYECAPSLMGRHISKTEPVRLLCDLNLLKVAVSAGRRPVSARSLRTPPRFLGIGRRSQGTETSFYFSDFPPPFFSSFIIIIFLLLAIFEVAELVNRSPVDRSSIDRYSGGNPTILGHFLALKCERRSTLLFRQEDGRCLLDHCGLLRDL